MGKVHKQVIDHIQNGQEIASAVTTDHLITAGVSNWGGSALVAALAVLNQCPVHSRYARRGVGTDRVASKKEVLNTLEMVMILVKTLILSLVNWKYLSFLLFSILVQQPDRRGTLEQKTSTRFTRFGFV